MEAKIHKGYSKCGSIYEAGNPRLEDQDGAFPYMRRLAMGRPWGSLNLRSGTSAYALGHGKRDVRIQQARPVFMQYRAHGPGEEAMSHAALEGAQEGRGKTKQGPRAKSLISIQVEHVQASQGELETKGTIAKPNRGEATEARRRPEARKKPLGRADITQVEDGGGWRRWRHHQF